MARSQKLAAEVALYGNGPTGVGSGWLARLADGTILGDGEPKAGRTFTDAVWLACEAVRQAGVTGGRVRVFAAGGRLMADTDLNNPGYFGNLNWRAATAYVVSADDILVAAS